MKRLRDWLTERLHWQLNAMEVQRRRDHAAVLAAIEEMKGQLMAGVAELEAAINDVKTAVAAETDRVEAVIAALKAGGDLQTQIDELESIKTALDAVEQTPGP